MSALDLFAKLKLWGKLWVLRRGPTTEQGSIDVQVVLMPHTFLSEYMQTQTLFFYLRAVVLRVPRNVFQPEYTFSRYGKFESNGKKRTRVRRMRKIMRKFPWC